jgi:hypothetical protein
MMPAADTVNTDVFAIDEDFNTRATQELNLKDELPSKSPSSFLTGLGSGPDSATAIKPESEAFPQNAASFSSQPFAPVGTPPTFSMNALSGSSPLAQSVVSQMKDRMNNIKSWRDFFAFDQFHFPQSSTAAQSRVSHNVNHFQNNYMMVIVLLSAFSL